MVKSRIKFFATCCVLLYANQAVANSYKHTLYFAKGAASLSPEILLNQMKQNVILEEVDLASHTLKKDGSDYYKINSSGMVPAITLQDGHVLTETAVILQYFADQDKSHMFLPKIGTNERYYVLEKLNFIATEIHKSIGAWFHSSDKAYFAKKIKTHIKTIDTLLEKKDFLANNKFSIADIYFIVSLLEIDNIMKIDITEFENIEKYLKKAKQHPSIRIVLKNEGLDKWLD